ncbi:MAG TPA: hypothetical protein PLQ68_04535 [Clostridia bacterium]|nr:hypothetical protein [Clostridia bacterium]
MFGNNKLQKEIDQIKHELFEVKKANDAFVSRAKMGSLGTEDFMKGTSNLEFLTELEPPTGLQLYYKMYRNEPIIGGIMLLLYNILSGLSWELTGSNKAFIKDMFDNFPVDMSSIFFDMASALCFGFYVGEMLITVDNGRIILVDIEPRFQTTIEKINNEEGNVVQQCTEGVYNIPYTKCVHHTFLASNRNPFGDSIIRAAYKPYYYKLSVEASEATGLERDLTGLPILTAPENFDFTAALETSPTYDPNAAETLQWAISLVGAVRKDSQQGIVKPSGWDFQIVRGENRTTTPTNEIIARYNTEMAISTLANFLALGAFASTNNANVGVHLNNFVTCCESYARKMCTTLQKVINRLCKYNNMTAPTLSLFFPNKSALKEVGEFVDKLTKNQVIRPTDSLEKSLLMLANLPYEKQKGDRNAKRDTENTDQ